MKTKFTRSQEAIAHTAGNSPHALIPLLDLSLVERLVVIHLDESINTPAAIRPDQLEHRRATRRIEITRDEEIVSAYQALLMSGPSPDFDGCVDTRWGVIFLGNNETRLLEVYMDKFGVQGVIGDGVVCFENGSLRRWLINRITL